MKNSNITDNDDTLPIWYAYYTYVDNDEGRTYTYGLVEESIDGIDSDEVDEFNYEKFFSKTKANAQLKAWREEHAEEEKHLRD